jgi:transcriptional regulatory protein LevR
LRSSYKDCLTEEDKSTKFSDHRTISLIAHTAKIVERILIKRTEKKSEDILGEDQFEFRRGKKTDLQLRRSEYYQKHFENG